MDAVLIPQAPVRRLVEVPSRPIGVEGAVGFVAETNQVAHGLLAQQLLHGPVRWREAVHVADGELVAGPPRGRDHGVALLHVDGHRFFHQHVFVGLQGGYGHFAVQAVRQADDDEVNPLVREQILIGGVALATVLRADAG